MSQQDRNAELVALLETDFVGRNEPNYAWKSAVSCLLALPGLRAAWPMSSVSYAQPECIDVSGQGNHLQAAAALGNVSFGYDNSASPKPLAPIANFAGGANQYLLKADGGLANWADIGLAGGDVQILGGQRGLTIGGWFWWTTPPGALQYLMAKWDGGPVQAQYSIRINAAGSVRMHVMPGPVAMGSTNIIAAGWNHCVGIYDSPNQDMHVVLNGELTSVLGAAPANLSDSTVPFTIGADGNGNNKLAGYASMCFLSAASISPVVITALFHQQRAMYNV